MAMAVPMMAVAVPMMAVAVPMMAVAVPTVQPMMFGQPAVMSYPMGSPAMGYQTVQPAATIQPHKMESIITGGPKSEPKKEKLAYKMNAAGELRPASIPKDFDFDKLVKGEGDYHVGFGKKIWGEQFVINAWRTAVPIMQFILRLAFFAAVLGVTWFCGGLMHLLIAGLIIAGAKSLAYGLHRVCMWFTEAIGFLSKLMNLDFYTVLYALFASFLLAIVTLYTEGYFCSDFGVVYMLLASLVAFAFGHTHFYYSFNKPYN
jgi:hypothetical protein